MSRHILQNTTVVLPFSHSQMWWGLESQVGTPAPSRISFEQAKTIYVAMELYANQGDLLAGSSTAGSPVVLAASQFNDYVLTADDTQPTGMRWGPAGVGEVNTASNLGVTAGRVGVFEQKVVADLQFNSLLSLTAGLTLNENTTNKEIEFTVADVVKSGNSGFMTGSDKRYLDDDVVDKNDFTNKGDILVGTGTGTYVQLPVGAADQVLTVDLAKATGVSWETPPGQGGGEANTASNVGTSGVGLWARKVAVDLQFKKVVSASDFLTITDNTGADTVDFSVNHRHSIAAVLDTGTTYLQLDGDLAIPGNNKVYGTDGIGTRGWYDTTASGEINVGQNVGTGVGWYKTKVGVNLQFKSVVSLTGCLTVTDNTGNDTVDLGLQTSGGSVVCFSNNLRLVNDEASPPGLYHYGTDASGNKGWFPQPTGVGGEANIGENIGTTTGRVGLYAGKVDVRLQFYSLVGRNGLTFTLDGADNEIDCDVNARWSVSSSTGWVQLVGDEDIPGNFQRYGTNDIGTRGWYPAADMFRSTYDAANVNQQLVGTTAPQTVSNKTITTSTIVQPTLILKQSANPTQTSEGDIQWDTDNNQIVIGSGSTPLRWSDDTKQVLRVDYTGKGVILAGTGVALFTALAPGGAGQVLTIDANETSGMKWADPPAGTGEANIGLNRGGGAEVYDGKSGVTLYFNTLTVPGTPALTIIESEALNQVQFAIADAVTSGNSGLFTGGEKFRLANDVVDRFDYTGLGVILAGTGTSSFTAKAPGTNGQILYANNGAVGGVEWNDAPAAGEVAIGVNRGNEVPVFDEKVGNVFFFNTLKTNTPALLVSENEAGNLVNFTIQNVGASINGLMLSSDKSKLDNDVLVRQDFDSTGDLLIGNGNDVYMRLPIGTEGQILTVSSTSAGGMQWATIIPGEANTGFNRGNAAHVFDEKIGTVLYFNSLLSMTPALTVAEEETSNQVRFTIADAAIGGNSGLFTPSEKDRLENDVVVRQDFDVRGDLLTGTGSNVYDRLGVGGNGQVLTANSSFPNGMIWQTPVGGGVTDHGDLDGLNDSSAWSLDHQWATVLGGRPTGQTLNGGNAINESLTLRSNATATPGNVIVPEIAAANVDPPNGYFVRINTSGHLSSHQYIREDDLQTTENPGQDGAVLTYDQNTGGFSWVGTARNDGPMILKTGAGGDGYLELDPGSQHPASFAKVGRIYAHESGSVVRLYASSENATNVIASHDPKTGEFCHESFNHETGYKQWINMFKLLGWLAEKYCEATGEPLESVWQHCPHDPGKYAELLAGSQAAKAAPEPA